MGMGGWDTVKRVIARVYVGGSLVMEEHCRVDRRDQSVVMATMYRASRITVAAERDGQPFCLELEDPDGAPGARYARWGTDARRMDQPRQFDHDADLWFDGFSTRDFAWMHSWQN